MRRIKLFIPALLMVASFSPAAKAQDEYVYDGGSLPPFEVTADPVSDTTVNWGSYSIWGGDYVSFYAYESAGASSGNPTNSHPKSGSPAWNAASKKAIKSATGRTGGVVHTLQTDDIVRAHLQDMLTYTHDSYKMNGWSIFKYPTAQEFDVAFWVRSDGSRTGDVAVGQSPPYGPNEGGVSSVTAPPRPGDGDALVLVHTHAWGTDISGANDGSPGDYSVSHQGPNGTYVIAIPMGTNTGEMIEPNGGQAYQGSSGDLSPVLGGTSLPQGFP